MLLKSLVVLSVITLAVVSIEGSHLPYLRLKTEEVHNNSNDRSTTATIATKDDLSNCNTIKDVTHCSQTSDSSSGDICVWCIAGAIPSECMSPHQATLLPPDVFDCSTPGVVLLPSTTTTTSATKTSSTSPSFHFDSTVFGTTQIYSLVNDHHHPSTSSRDGHHVFRTDHDDAAQSPPQPSPSDLCDASSNSLSGYMDISGSQYDANNENKHLFYWFFEQRNQDQQHHTDHTTTDTTIPFVVWLTGGPGCSSTLALLTENGPCTVNTDGATTKHNPYSWTEAGHVLWLDQPAGVGFSYGQETDTNEQMISEDAYYFLQAFFQTYTQYQNNPLFIVGESYGGHYAPAIAHRIWMGNKNLKPGSTIHLNLSGLGIGNGLTDPAHQYPAYVDMVTNNSHNITIVDEGTADAMRAVVPQCVALINQCNAGDSLIDTFACQSAFLLCNSGLTSPYQLTGLNPYDIRIKCEHRPLCYDFSHIQNWLNLESTMKSLNVDERHSHSWSSCNFGINMKFHTDWMKDFSGYIADLLNDGIPALIYAGDVDFICNYIGNRAWTLALQWDGSDEFVTAEEHEWKGQGLARSAKGLTFLQVYDAGHMVPSDQPVVALDMITNFLNGGVF